MKFKKHDAPITNMNKIQNKMSGKYKTVNYPCLNTECKNEISKQYEVPDSDVGCGGLTYPVFELCHECIETHVLQALTEKEMIEQDIWDIFPTTHYKAVKKQ